MSRYIARRLLQMIPTVAGVILVAFLLFNVVGGSPAAMVLGQNVSAAALEEFDEQRGFNKPLFCGHWVATRALRDQAFETGAGAWQKTAGIEWTNGVLRLKGPGEYALPLAFALRPGEDYRLELEYRAAPETAAEIFPMIGKIPGEFSNDWKKFRGIFQSLENPAQAPRIVVSAGTLELRTVRLRRGTAHFFDSQLLHYLGRLAHLDFGISSSMNQPVARLLRAGIGPSLALTVPILLCELVVSVSLALLCAFWRNSWLDRSLVLVSVALMSINYLVMIVFGQYVLAFKLGWFPIWGFESWRHLLLPILIGTATGLGANVRFYRTIMLEEMQKDYVRTAFAKGLSHTRVLFKHVLKNAMIPVITNVAMAIPFLYTGSLLLESFFGIPGLGYLGVNAINSSDVDVVRAVVLVGSVLFLLANLAADLCYAWVDPRVKLG